MKYMGSKKSMLQNGLGELLSQEVHSAHRFVDLFTGAGHVAWHVAEAINKPVFAVDMQNYATILAKAVIGRTEEIDFEMLEDEWIKPAIQLRDNSIEWIEANSSYLSAVDVQTLVYQSRKLCEKTSEIGPCWNAYGGHYFSPAQALTFDFLLAMLPKREPQKTVSLAAIISSASECVASPGHTAQPFQPTASAAPFIMEAWSRDPIYYCRKALLEICPRYAQVEGEVKTADALFVAKMLNKGDLVFIDPPYSDVQYSRFYHVLETLARGKKSVNVEGAGRYPPISERPQSNFSRIGQSKSALRALLETLARNQCRVIFTFPDDSTSNGLSGSLIKNIAKEWFTVEDRTTVKGKFSTLGGNNSVRDARNNSSELILLMKPL